MKKDKPKDPSTWRQVTIGDIPGVFTIDLAEWGIDPSEWDEAHKKRTRKEKQMEKPIEPTRAEIIAGIAKGVEGFLRPYCQLDTVFKEGISDGVYEFLRRSGMTSVTFKEGIAKGVVDFLEKHPELIQKVVKQ